MIPLFLDASTRNALTYNGFTFNQLIGGSRKDIIEVNSVVPQSAIQANYESREFATGLETYGAYKRGKRLVHRGVIRASSAAKLYSYIEQMAAAFDPDIVSRDNPDTFGVLPLDFNVPTDDTGNFPGGLMACRYYVRAEQAFEPPVSQYSGVGTPFVLSLMASDPRRYLQAQSSITIAAGFFGDTLADNSVATVWSWPTLTITMSGAGGLHYQISSDLGNATLELNLSSLSAGDVVVVDMENALITLNGSAAPDLYVSGDFFTVEPGVNTISTLNNGQAQTLMTWRSAFAH